MPDNARKKKRSPHEIRAEKERKKMWRQRGMALKDNQVPRGPAAIYVTEANGIWALRDDITEIVKTALFDEENGVDFVSILDDVLDMALEKYQFVEWIQPVSGAQSKWEVSQDYDLVKQTLENKTRRIHKRLVEEKKKEAEKELQERKNIQQFALDAFISNKVVPTETVLENYSSVGTKWLDEFFACNVALYISGLEAGEHEVAEEILKKLYAEARGFNIVFCVLDPEGYGYVPWEWSDDGDDFPDQIREYLQARLHYTAMAIQKEGREATKTTSPPEKTPQTAALEGASGNVSEPGAVAEDPPTVVYVEDASDEAAQTATLEGASDNVFEPGVAAEDPPTVAYVEDDEAAATLSAPELAQEYNRLCALGPALKREIAELQKQMWETPLPDVSPSPVVYKAIMASLDSMQDQIDEKQSELSALQKELRKV
ncbi:MAG: hypothetical protein SGARI_004411, partial [Bacillariaceae sp.]